MNSRHRKWTRAALLCLPVLLIVLPIWIVSRAQRQAQIDYRLIQAIKAEDTPAILEALQTGANGNARDLGRPTVSLYGTLLRLLNRWRPGGVRQSSSYYPTALILLLTPHVPPVSSPDFPNYILLPQPPRENAPVVKMLLEHGADISERDTEQKTPVMRAFEYGWMETVCVLVEAGASPRVYNAEGEPPLTYADAQQAAVLIQHGAEVNARYPGGGTPLMRALCPPHLHPDTVPLLLAKGADANARDDFGTTPLLLATLFTDATTMQCLLEHGADANRGELAGQTPLIAAVLSKDIARVRLLLEHGAKTTTRDATGATALQWAQKIHASSLVELLRQAERNRFKTGQFTR